MHCRCNPEYFSNVLEGTRLFEEKIFGFHELEIYPHVIYDANPFSLQHISQLDNWIALHSAELPFELENMSFRDVHLLILVGRSYFRANWYVYHRPTQIILGRGTLDSDESGQYLTTVTAFSAFQGFRIYETVLHIIYDQLGPIQSSDKLSPGAKKAWQRAGAVWMPDRSRWILKS